MSNPISDLAIFLGREMMAPPDIPPSRGPSTIARGRSGHAALERRQPGRLACLRRHLPRRQTARRHTSHRLPVCQYATQPRWSWQRWRDGGEARGFGPSLTSRDAGEPCLPGLIASLLGRQGLKRPLATPRRSIFGPGHARTGQAPEPHTPLSIAPCVLRQGRGWKWRCNTSSLRWRGFAS